jgi:hypothetical protein
MAVRSHRFIAGIGIAAIICTGFWAGDATAQDQSQQGQAQQQAPVTVAAAEAFLKAAGLQSCEVSEIDPFVAQFNGAIKSFSIGVAENCAAYDADNPTVVTVYQFDNTENRDAVVAGLRNLRYRALQTYGDIWAVDHFVVVILGPNRASAAALIKAEYHRRHPEQG